MSNLKYRPDIDGLRAIAVLGVLLFHAGLGFPGGYVGVDVFFVISGFLITSLILKELRTGRFSFLRFWERRIRRILPALAFIVLAVLFFGFFTLPPEPYQQLGRQVISLVFCVSNVIFWRETGYFDAAAEEKVLLHTWSLSVEEQFYVAVPICLFLLSRCRRLHWTLLFLAAVCLISFAASVYGSYRHPSAAFYLLPTRAWELGAGSMLAFARPLRRGMWRNSAGWLGLALILSAYFFYPPDIRFPGTSALPPVIGAVLFIWAGAGDQRQSLPNRVLTLRPFVWVGLISYSLYLWHWPILAYQKWLGYSTDSTSTQILLVIISCTLAWISWKFVEKPFRNRSFLSKQTSVFLLAGVTGFSGLTLACSILIGDGWDWRFTGDAKKRISLEYGHLPYDRVVGEDEIQALGPFSGDPHSRALVYVWGDSHAMAILPAVEEASSKLGFVCYASTRYTTPPLLEGFARLRPPPKMAWDQKGPSWNDAVFDDLKRKANQYEPTIVVLAGLWRDYSVEEQFEAAFLATITRIQSIGVDRVIVFRQVPTFNQFSPKPFYSPISVFHANNKDVESGSSFVAVGDYQKMRSHLNLFFNKLKERGVEVIDPLDVLPQDKRRFTAVIGSAESRTPLFQDHSHLNVEGASLFIDRFESAFRDVLPTN